MVPKRVSDRLVRSVAKFQEVLRIAKDRDVNESDTVSIIKDILAEVFGYDKYLEITSEFAIRGTYCDLAIKVDDEVEYLIEAKAIGLDLKDGHLRQAIDYGATNGVQWIILTNGMMWHVYKIKFEQPISHDLVCTLNFAGLDSRNLEHLERLFIICKEGLVKDAREEFHQKIMTVNRFVLGSLILSDEVVTVLRRELRKFPDAVPVTREEIVKVLANEVLKREVIDGEEALRTQARVRRIQSKAAKGSRQAETRKPCDENTDTSGAEIPSCDHTLDRTDPPENVH